MSAQHPKISIITVTYNAAQFIEKTIQSVASQTYKNREYIIVDGLSKDSTNDIIKKYPEVVTTHVSEKDAGLYDAMNKAIRLATGDYLLFINAGDLLFDDEVLSKVFEQSGDHDLIYGDTTIIDTNYKTVGMRHMRPPEKLNWKSFKGGMVVCHQAIIAKRAIVPFYDTQYRVAADIDWAIRLTKAAKSCYFYRDSIVQFMQDGISTQYRVLGLKERFRVMKEYYGLIPTVLRNIWLGTKYFASFRFINNTRK